MKAYQGYYALIQFCPDRERSESFNVGVMIVCPDLDAVRVKMTPSDPMLGVSLSQTVVRLRASGFREVRPGASLGHVKAMGASTVHG